MVEWRGQSGRRGGRGLTAGGRSLWGSPLGETLGEPLGEPLAETSGGNSGKQNWGNLWGTPWGNPWGNFRGEPLGESLGGVHHQQKCPKGFLEATPEQKQRTRRIQR